MNTKRVCLLLCVALMASLQVISGATANRDVIALDVERQMLIHAN